MPTVTFIVGLAGSGKTHRAEELERTNGAKPFEGIGGRPGGIEEVMQHLRSGGDCTVEELQSLRMAWRQDIETRIKREVPGVIVRWIFFENDLATANWNVTHRDDPTKDPGSHVALNNSWTQKYEIPEDVVPEPIKRIPAKKP